MSTTKLNISDLTDKQIKGIDLTFKALKKYFPFLISWEFSQDTYKSILFINTFVDVNILSNYLNAPIDPFILPIIKKEPFQTSTLEDYFILNDNPKQLKNNIRHKLLSLYETIPDDFAINNTMQSSLSSDTLFNFRVDIIISSFILTYYK